MNCVSDIEKSIWYACLVHAGGALDILKVIQKRCASINQQAIKTANLSINSMNLLRSHYSGSVENLRDIYLIFANQLGQLTIIKEQI